MDDYPRYASQQPSKMSGIRTTRRGLVLPQKVLDKVIPLLEDVNHTPRPLVNHFRMLVNSNPRGDTVILNSLSESVTSTTVHRILGTGSGQDNWLCDTGMNVYLKVLAQREILYRQQDPSERDTFLILTSQWYTQFAEVNRANVDRWWRGRRINDYDYIVVPIHEGIHWIAAIVDTKQRIIKFYDPMSRCNRSHTDNIRAFLARREKLDGVKDPRQWRVRDPPSNCASQLDTVSCGFLTLIYINLLTSGKNLDSVHSTVDVPHYRHHVGAIICSLLPSKR
jgi:hypothetical protein